VVSTLDVEFLFREGVLVKEFATNRLVLNVYCVDYLDPVCLLALDFWQPVLICCQETVVNIARASLQAYFRVDCVYNARISSFSCNFILNYLHV
jgi:hypothetical protein